ncbi:hypothetical protein OV079_46660 [Nannocystis pusilla]|uniref:Uncharacterized protein n=1 Tax=Nannocystis pusilla TaxID=889268 RepID=A0A9X3J3J9_9BACT|nr:hypothetical protein [Nannocystis pusilla]MCY1012899.1 hypothetical protein [Nannocystis pusilla]
MIVTYSRFERSSSTFSKLPATRRALGVADEDHVAGHLAGLEGDVVLAALRVADVGGGLVALRHVCS